MHHADDRQRRRLRIALRSRVLPLHLESRCSPNPRNRIGHAVAPQRCALATWHYTCARLRGPGMASHGNRRYVDLHQDLPATIRLIGPTIFGTLVAHRRSHLCAQSHCGLDCVPSASRTAQCQRSKCADQCDSQRCGLPGRCDADDGRGELDALLLPGIRTMLFDLVRCSAAHGALWLRASVRPSACQVMVFRQVGIVWLASSSVAYLLTMTGFSAVLSRLSKP